MSTPPTSLRTPLASVRGLGSAKEGVGHWIWQRLTALALAVLGMWFVYALVFLFRDGDIATVHTFFASAFNTICMILLLLSLFYHSMLGIQVIVEDYVHGKAKLILLLIVNKFAHIVLAAMALLAVARLHYMGV